MQQLKNQLIVFCGDSTTEQGQQSNVGGLYARLMNQHAIAGGRLDGIAGVVNYGMSGYQLSDFANTAADHDFTGAAAGDSDWDFCGNKKQGIWGGVSAADAIKIKGDIYIICFGINDLILTELGLKTQKECEEYIVRNMSIALKKIKSALPAWRGLFCGFPAPCCLRLICRPVSPGRLFILILAAIWPWMLRWWLNGIRH